MRICGKQATPGLALAIAIPLIPCLALLTSSGVPATRCTVASCHAVPSSAAHAGLISSGDLPCETPPGHPSVCGSPEHRGPIADSSHHIGEMKQGGNQ